MKKIILSIAFAFTMFAGTALADCGSGLTGEACNEGVCIDRNDICVGGICERQGGAAIIWKHARFQNVSIEKRGERVYEINIVAKNMREWFDGIMIGSDITGELQSGKKYTRSFEVDGRWRAYSNSNLFTLPDNAVQNDDGSYTINLWLKNWHGTGEWLKVIVE